MSLPGTRRLANWAWRVAAAVPERPDNTSVPDTACAASPPLRQTAHARGWAQGRRSKPWWCCQLAYSRFEGAGCRLRGQGPPDAQWRFAALLLLQWQCEVRTMQCAVWASPQVTARSCAACRAALQAALQSGQHHNARHFTCVNVHPVALLRPKVMTARLLMGEVSRLEGWVGRNLPVRSAAKGCGVHPALDGRSHCASHQQPHWS